MQKVGWEEIASVLGSKPLEEQGVPQGDYSSRAKIVCAYCVP